MFVGAAGTFFLLDAGKSKRMETPIAATIAITMTMATVI